LEEADPPGHLFQHQLRRAARPRIEEPGVDERVVLVRARARARARERARERERVRVRIRVRVRVRVRVTNGLSCCTTSEALVARQISCSAGKGSCTQTVSVST